jgi:hypothetical protein
MANPLTLRLDEKMWLRIARIARRRHLSTSEVIRQAIEAWAERQEPVACPYELVSDPVRPLFLFLGWPTALNQTPLPSFRINKLRIANFVSP